MLVGSKSIIGRRLTEDFPGYGPTDTAVMKPDQPGHTLFEKNEVS